MVTWSDNPFEGAPASARTKIDELVFRRLGEIGITPSRVCSDAVFVRRAYLDVIGTLPTPAEVMRFLAKPNRTALIDELLRRDEFAEYWALKWSDLLRIKSEFPINLWPMAAQAYHRWVRDSIRADRPYDGFARDLLTASGSNFKNPPVNFYRALQSKKPETIAQNVALTFMGCRAEKWPKHRQASMAAFFAGVAYKQTGEWKEEIVYFDYRKPAVTSATFPDGSSVKVPPGVDTREVFADWLISPKNPWFAKNIANRVWSWLFGRGIIDEPDDIRPDNPPQNAALLDYLVRELVGAQFDLKHLFRLILNSNAYQLSAIPRSGNPKALSNFARYRVRRLEAEVLIDALDQITGTTESYSSPIPEPFTFLPENDRSIAIPDGSISSAFLEMFGRPPRDTGLESERNNRPAADQSLHMLNSSHVQRKLDRGPKLSDLIRSGKSKDQVLADLYLAILSRTPTAEERQNLQAFLAKSGNWTEAATDVAWALINSAEFQFRH